MLSHLASLRVLSELLRSAHLSSSGLNGSELSGGLLCLLTNKTISHSSIKTAGTHTYTHIYTHTHTYTTDAYRLERPWPEEKGLTGIPAHFPFIAGLHEVEGWIQGYSEVLIPILLSNNLRNGQISRKFNFSFLEFGQFSPKPMRVKMAIAIKIFDRNLAKQENMWVHVWPKKKKK